jgi:hypothetical protein
MSKRDANVGKARIPAISAPGGAPSRQNLPGRSRQNFPQRFQRFSRA